MCNVYQQMTNVVPSGIREEYIGDRCSTCTYIDEHNLAHAGNVKRAFSVITHEMCMFLYHQACLCTNNHCHVSRCKLADLRHQHLYSGQCLNVNIPVSEKICYPPSRKLKIQPALTTLVSPRAQKKNGNQTSVIRYHSS